MHHIAREYGRAMLQIDDKSCPLFKNIPSNTQVWMSHGDTISVLPKGAVPVASTGDIANAAYELRENMTLQFNFIRK